MKPVVLIRLSCLALALVVSAGAHAQSAAYNSVDEQVMTSETFLSSHPDLRFRLIGLKAYEAGDYEKALTEFRRAARYGDKPSQGMVAEMLWNGQGTPVDRPLAYAWMDLAAERQFKVMLVNRERYWKALNEAERKHAIEVGQPVFAEYADKVAKPRMERELRKARRNTTGSRTGFVGSLRIIIPGPSGDITLDGSQYYQDKFWKPEAYWKWQAEDWKELPKGRVEVGPLKIPAVQAPAPKAPERR